MFNKSKLKAVFGAALLTVSSNALENENFNYEVTSLAEITSYHYMTIEPGTLTPCNNACIEG